MDITPEAKTLASIAHGIPRGEAQGFRVDAGYHGQEDEIIKAAQAILHAQGETRITLTSHGPGHIRIET